MRAAIALAARLQMTVIGAGVETLEQRALLAAVMLFHGLADHLGRLVGQAVRRQVPGVGPDGAVHVGAVVKLAASVRLSHCAFTAC